jgi:methionyl-tRNA formyltransferase
VDQSRGVQVLEQLRRDPRRRHGLVLQRVRDEDGVEHVAGDYFRRMGDYLT